MGGCASHYCCTSALGTVYDPPELEDAGPRRGHASSSALYVALPSAHDGAAVDRDARLLLRALSGVRVDDAALGRLVSSRTPEQLQAIKRAFEARYARGETLERWLADDTTGEWARTLLLAVTDRAERDADLLEASFTREGFGDPDGQVRFVLGTGTHAHVKRVAAAYHRDAGRSLSAALRRHARRDPLLQQTLMAAVERAEFLAHRVRAALRASPRDDAALVRLLAGLPRDGARHREWAARFEDNANTGMVAEMEAEATMPDLADLVDAYKRVYSGAELADEVRDAVPDGPFRDTLLALLSPPAEALAAHFYRALHGPGTGAADHALLTELVVSRSPRELLAAERAYDRLYGEGLRKAVRRRAREDGGSERYAAMLDTLLEPAEETVAHQVRRVLDGSPDDDTVVALVAQLGRGQVAGTARAYRRLYGGGIEEQLAAARGGGTHGDRWNRRLLRHVVRTAPANLLHVPRSHLLRVRDL